MRELRAGHLERARQEVQELVAANQRMVRQLQWLGLQPGSARGACSSQDDFSRELLWNASRDDSPGPDHEHASQRCLHVPPLLLEPAAHQASAPARTKRCVAPAAAAASWDTFKKVCAQVQSIILHHSSAKFQACPMTCPWPHLSLIGC